MVGDECLVGKQYLCAFSCAKHLSLITKKLSYEKNDLGQDFEGNHRGGFGYNRRF